MNVVSLLQPWATLVAIGAKQFETRSWKTPYRGPLLIHASKGKDRAGRDLWNESSVGFPSFDELPFGRILCEVRLLEVHRAEDIEPWLDDREAQYGNYAPGRFAWKLQLVRRFKEPIMAKGRLGFWNFDLPEGLL
ncbi:MAG: ASCH domain-containing protein [Verrucomicrobiota bacterium]